MPRPSKEERVGLGPTCRLRDATLAGWTDTNSGHLSRKQEYPPPESDRESHPLLRRAALPVCVGGQNSTSPGIRTQTFSVLSGATPAVGLGMQGQKVVDGDGFEPSSLPRGSGFTVRRLQPLAYPSIVLQEGFDPSRGFPHTALDRARLPISPPEQIQHTELSSRAAPARGRRMHEAPAGVTCPGLPYVSGFSSGYFNSQLRSQKCRKPRSNNGASCTSSGIVAVRKLPS